MTPPPVAQPPVSGTPATPTYSAPAAEPVVPSQYSSPTPPPTSIKRFLPGAAVIVFGVVLIILGLALGGSPGTAIVPSTTSIDTNLSTAASRYDANNVSTASAPQQQVVNGWYTNDLLIIVANAVSDTQKSDQALAENQQKILSSNSKVVLFTWLSISILLVGIGVYFILDKALD